MVEVYPPATLESQVEAYALEHEISISQAWQELTRRGLQREELQE